jgi:hypothetical protein
VITSCAVYELGVGRTGSAWSLSLEDYRRVIIVHDDQDRWFIAS